MPENKDISVKEAWKKAGRARATRMKLIIGSVLIFIIMFLLPYFFAHIEKRKGAVLNDWVLEQIPAHNVSVPIFVVIWGMALLIIYRAAYKPAIYIRYCWALIFVCILRMISISLVALDPPPGLIPLVDPLTGIFYGEVPITKDLFFSGHTSILTLIFLCLEKKTDKRIGLAAVIIVAFLLLVQHIHYTIDILVAPLVTYCCYLFTRKFVL